MSRPEIKAERRRRKSGSLQGARQRLYVDESKLDRENYEYYFANDDGNRIHQMTVADDWEVVSDRDGAVKNSNMGSGVSHLAGTKEGGDPLNAVLLRKPKRYHDEDVAEEQRAIDAKEEAIKTGATAEGGLSENAYIPKEGISITH